MPDFVVYCALYAKVISGKSGFHYYFTALCGYLQLNFVYTSFVNGPFQDELLSDTSIVRHAMQHFSCSSMSKTSRSTWWSIHRVWLELKGILQVCLVSVMEELTSRRIVFIGSDINLIVYMDEIIQPFKSSTTNSPLGIV